MKVWVRPHVLASARHVWLLVKMSGVVSMSINQSSSSEESFPSDVGKTCSRIMLVFACIVVCTGSSLGWGFGHGWSATARCHNPSASLATPPYVWMGGWQVPRGMVSWSQSHWK